MNIEETLKNLESKLNTQQELLQAIYNSNEKTRKYFQLSLILTVVFFFLPLIALVFVLPMALSSYTSALNLGI